MHFTQAKQGVKQTDNNKDIKQSHCRGCGCGSHSGIFHARRWSFILLGHSRMFLSGIFDACSYQIRKTLFGKRQLRGRSPITTLGDDGLCVYNGNGGMMRDPGQKPSGMTLCDGFTLIELLVVVLIIGILAAVAVPQYQKAVEKSKAAQALSFLKTVVQAEESFYMANGYYTSFFEKLDIELTWSGKQGFAPNWSNAISNDEWSLQANLSEVSYTTVDMVGVLRLTGEYKGAGFAYIMDSNHSTNYKSGLYCVERIEEGYTFEKNKGDYCKLFGGTYVTSVIGLNLFSI